MSSQSSNTENTQTDVTQNDLDQARYNYNQRLEQYNNSRDTYQTLLDEYQNMDPNDPEYEERRQQVEEAEENYEEAQADYEQAQADYEALQQTYNDINNIDDAAEDKANETLNNIKEFFSPLVIFFLVLTVVQFGLGFTLFGKDTYKQSFYLLFLGIFLYSILFIYMWYPQDLFESYPDITLILYLVIAGYLMKSSIPDLENPGNLISKMLQYFGILLWLFVILITVYVFFMDTYIMEFAKYFVYLLIFSTGFFVILNMIYTGMMYPKREQADFKTRMSEASKNIMFTTKWFVYVAFGFAIIGSIFHWFSQLVSAASTSSGIINLIVNLIILLVILAICYRALIASDFYNNSPYVQLVTETILYIPCLLVSLIDYFVKLFNIGSTSEDSLDKEGEAVPDDAPKSVKKQASPSSLFNPSTTDYVLLGTAVGLNAAYFSYPYVYKSFSKQGGLQLVNKPVYTTTEYGLADYGTLHGKDTFDYQYAISFWSFLDAAGSSVGKSYNEYASILNYGGKPNVQYKAVDNTILITLDIDPVAGVNIKPPYDANNFDTDNKYILYKSNKIKLQKWNHFVINYNGATIDTFINGELVRSIKGVVPYMTNDILTIGQNEGAQGGVCNVVYFNEPVTAEQIYYLYNSVRMFTPPIVTNSNETIINIAKRVPSTMNKNDFINYSTKVESSIRGSIQ